MSSPVDPITQSNAQFIEHLTGREQVGVDKDGRLYTVRGFCNSAIFLCSAKRFQPGIDKRMGEAIKEHLSATKVEWQKKGTDIEQKQAFYRDLASKLSRMHLLSDDNKALLMNDFYEQRYQDLIQKGNPPFVAESIASIEMSQDPSVPKSLRDKVAPQLTRSGVNGTYIVKNRQGENIAIFKPMDEELYMPNNPRDRREAYDPKKPLREPYRGHEQGTGWKKEVAASVLDSDKVADVPKTLPISVRFPKQQGSSESVVKRGSLQKFVQGKPLEQLSSEEIAKLPTKEVQKLAALDLILGNADRNLGNCFWDGEKIIPIDHGFSFLDSADWREDNPKPRSDMNCHWTGLPQIKEPFSEELREWVLSLNPKEIAKDLREKAELPETCIREFMIRTMIFQKALSAKKDIRLDEVTPMLMLTADERGCLLDNCSERAAKACEKFSKEWEKLPPKEAAEKRFEVYFEMLQKIVDEELEKILI